MSETATDLKRTPLYESHLKLSAKMVPFAGWEMPVLYNGANQGLIAEHAATRTAAGLFDVSHMGEIRVKGPEAIEALNYLTCNNISRLVDGQAQYGAILNEEAGVIDDIIVYRFSADNFLICVNASNAAADYQWLSAKNKHDVVITNESSDWGQIAIQGPKAIEITEKYFKHNLSDIKPFRFKDLEYEGSSVLVARTGYTGEDGFEIFMPARFAKQIWDGLLSAGADFGIKPCGLGARDTLRLEAAMPLHGHELGPQISAVDCGLERYIALDKPEFIGKQALMAHKQSKNRKKLVGFELKEAGISRADDKVFADEELLGKVTSGTKTPTINKAIGLALISCSNPETDYPAGQRIFVEIRGRKVSAEIVSIPFYKRKKS